MVRRAVLLAVRAGLRGAARPAGRLAVRLAVRHPQPGSLAALLVAQGAVRRGVLRPVPAARPVRQAGLAAALPDARVVVRLDAAGVAVRLGGVRHLGRGLLLLLLRMLLRGRGCCGVGVGQVGGRRVGVRGWPYCGALRFCCGRRGRGRGPWGWLRGWVVDDVLAARDGRWLRGFVLGSCRRGHLRRWRALGRCGVRGGSWPSRVWHPRRVRVAPSLLAQRGVVLAVLGVGRVRVWAFGGVVVVGWWGRDIGCRARREPKCQESDCGDRAHGGDGLHERREDLGEWQELVQRPCATCQAR